MPGATRVFDARATSSRVWAAAANREADLRGRVLQILGVVVAVLAAAWFYFTAGGQYGYAEFSQVWARYLASRPEPKIGLLGVVAGVVAFAVGSLQRRDDVAKR